MTNQKKYVAYVSTYTMGDNHGITIYDVDVENGILTPRNEVEVSNSSYVSVSRNLKYLYSIEDDGVAVFKRDGNGDLERLNSVDIEGMRGCFLSTDYSGNYLFVGGYHDGKVTLVEILPDLSLIHILPCHPSYRKERPYPRQPAHGTAQS